MSAIRIVDLSKRYNDRPAVDRVSFTVGDGEFVTLLGPSGCGKTTTLRLISGFVRPDAGQIFFDALDVTALPPYEREIGMVFQSLALFPHMSVAANVAYGLETRRVARAEVQRQVEAMLKLVQMSGFGARRPHELSGGQRQRVAFARALAHEPRILLLDEPFAALDRKLREEMQVELRQLHGRLGVTTIFVTHDQREAFTLSDRVVVMNEGGIEQIAPPQDVYYRPATRFVASFVGTANLLPAEILEGTGETIRIRLTEEDKILTLPASGANGGTAAQTIDKARSALAMVRPEFVTLQRTSSREESFPATLTLLRFLGDQVEARVTTRSGRELTALLGGQAARELHSGETVAIALAPEQIRLFPEPG